MSCRVVPHRLELCADRHRGGARWHGARLTRPRLRQRSCVAGGLSEHWDRGRGHGELRWLRRRNRIARPAMTKTATTIPAMRATLPHPVPLLLSVPADVTAPVVLRPPPAAGAAALNIELRSATAASRVPIGCRPKRCSMVAMTDVV